MATYNFNTSAPTSQASERSLLSKTFLYMFLMILGTAAISFGLVFLCEKLGLDDRGYAIMLMTASISQIVLTVFIFFTSIRPGKVSVIPMVLYTICMGVLISGFGKILNPWTLASSFGIAALAFGGMALIGLRSKNASRMGMIGYGLFFSALLAGLFNGLMAMLLGPEVWTTTNIIVSVLIVIAVMLITAYDVYNVKAISATGMNNSNLALFLAFHLYIDFLMILIRILQIVMISQNNRR